MYDNKIFLFLPTLLPTREYYDMSDPLSVKMNITFISTDIFKISNNYIIHKNECLIIELDAGQREAQGGLPGRVGSRQDLHRQVHCQWILCGTL